MKHAEISVVNVVHNNPKSEKVIKVHIPVIRHVFIIYHNNTVPQYGYASYTENDVMIYDKVYDVIKDFHDKFKNMNPTDYNNKNDFFSDAVAELQEHIDAVLEDCVEVDNDVVFIASKV